MPDLLKKLFEAEKEMSRPPRWREDGSYYSFSVPLLVENVLIEGFAFRGKMRMDRPRAAITFQLDYMPSNAPCAQLERIEWRPPKTHKNNKGPAHLYGLVIVGSHHHRFELNWNEAEGVMLTGNLPVAEEISPDFQTFEELVEFVDKRFRIKNLVGILPHPEWTGSLFGDD